MWLIDLSNNFLTAISAGWNVILSWLTTSLADVLDVVSDIPIVGSILESVLGWISVDINGVSVKLIELTPLQLIFGIGLPLFLGFTFIKWLLNLIT